MPKKILVFIGVFIGVCVLAVVVFIKGTPTAMDSNPLQGLEPAALGKIEVRVSGSTRTFVQKDQGWLVQAPVSDLTDPDSFPPFVDYLTRFTIDSIISENPDRHNKFGVDESKGKRLLVYKKGQSKPALDGFFGITAGSFDSSYFRFYEGEKVHIANGFPIYYLSRSGNDFRLKKVIPANIKEAAYVKIQQEKDLFEIQWSSPTWVHGKTEKEFPAEKAKKLLAALDDWKVWSFSEDGVDDQTAGLDVPSILVELKGPNEQAEVRIGKPVPKKGLNLPDRRYAKVNGRDALLIIRDDALDKILNLSSI